MEDTIKVIVDYGMAKKGSKKKNDTGSFKLIYKGEKTKNTFQNLRKKSTII